MPTITREKTDAGPWLTVVDDASGGSLPSWWTVDDTPGSESVDFGSGLFSIEKSGKVGQGALAGAPIQWYDSQPTIVPVADTDAFGTAGFKLGIGMRVQAAGANQAADDLTTLYQGMQTVVKSPADDKRQGFVLGQDAAAIFRGTKAPGTYQLSVVQGGRHSAQDYDYSASGAAATGTLSAILGGEGYGSHAGQSNVGSVVGFQGVAQAEKLLAVTPGTVDYMAAITAIVNSDNSFGTLAALYGIDLTRGAFSAPVVTEAAGIRIPNFGDSGTVTSYGIKIAAQSGSTTNYAIYSGGGRVFLSLPTSNPGAGILWNDTGTVKVGT